MNQRHHWRSGILVTGVLVVLSFNANAASMFFVAPGGIGNWDVPENWAAAQPGPGDTAFLHAGRIATVDTVVSLVPDIVRIADHNVAGANDGQLNILPGGELTVQNQMLVAVSGDPDVYGVIDQSGGSLTVSDALFLAFESANKADYNLSGGSANIGNLWFRFGEATLTQTGGTMTAQNLVLGEGGDGSASSLYDLRGGSFNVIGTANIGKALGAGDPLPNSLGSMLISGGTATFGQLLFGNDPTDTIQISGQGILRINQSAFGEAAALMAIASGNITGQKLAVSTVIDGMQTYTQIVAVPEPMAFTCAAILAMAGICVRPQSLNRKPS